MSTLYENDFMTLTDDGETLTFVWSREEPNDEHATATAESIKSVLVAYASAHPGTKRKVLIDLGPVKKTFPRAIATYAGVLISLRAMILRGAFVTKSFLLRTAVSAAFLIPGLTMKGFSDLTEAKAFVENASH